MDAGLERRFQVGAMAEAFINLAEDPHRNVGEIQVVPVQLQLEHLSDRLPAVQDGMKVQEKIRAGLILHSAIEVQVGRLATCAVRGRDGFIDQTKKIAIEGFVEPGRRAGGLFRARKDLLEACGRRADFRQLALLHDSAIDQKTEEQRPAGHGEDGQRFDPLLLRILWHEFVGGLFQQLEDLLENMVGPLDTAGVFKRPVDQTLKKEGRARVLVLYGPDGLPGFLAEADRVDFERAGFRQPEPGGLAAIGQEALRFGETGKVHLTLAGHVQHVKQRRSLVLGNPAGNDPGVTPVREQIEVVDLLRAAQRAVELDERGAAKTPHAFRERTCPRLGRNDAHGSDLEARGLQSTARSGGTIQAEHNSVLPTHCRRSSFWCHHPGASQRPRRKKGRSCDRPRKKPCERGWVPPRVSSIRFCRYCRQAEEARDYGSFPLCPWGPAGSVRLGMTFSALAPDS